MVSRAVQERVDRSKAGLPTHDLPSGYYWVRAHGRVKEVAYWDGRSWRGSSWEGGNLHVDVLSARIPEPTT